MKKVPVFVGLALMTAVGSVALAHGGGFARADKNDDGKITMEEAIAAGKEMFQRKDANKDGALSKEELGDRGGRFLEKADTNQDGRITVGEGEVMLRAKFAKHDKNNDGVLSGDELRRGHGKRDRNHEKS